MNGNLDDMEHNRQPSPSTEWDAQAYHRLSAPQVSWGETVIDRLSLRGNETILDAGCGTGRLTAELLERVPGGRVIAVDRSVNMLEQAREHLIPRFGDRISVVQADLAALDMDGVADVIFSTATFHWITDHPRLFQNLFHALKPGGVLVAQCGGGPNLAHLLERVSRIMQSPPYGQFFAGWRQPWEFANPDTTSRRLHAAGFVNVRTGLVSAPVTMPNAGEYRAFLSTIVLRHHLECIPDATLREQFLDVIVDQGGDDDPPFLLDYWRLNLAGMREG